MQVKSSDRLQTVTEFGAALRECQQSITQPKPVTQNKSSVPRQEEIPPKKDVISQPENAIRHNSKREQNIPEKEDVPIDKDKSDGEPKPVVPFWRKKGMFALGVSLLIVVSYIINMDTWTDPVPGMEFVWVPGGCYQMGCGSWTSDCGIDESPVHEVCVDGFWISQNEVTQGQWMKLMESNPSAYRIGGNYPVENVSWEDAKEYIRRLNGKGGAKFRLPSEAEWEYAARSGGKPEKYSGGADVGAVAWYGSRGTHPVKTKMANGLGIYDMSGNVWEWCEDAYISDIYGKSENSKNPVYTSGGSNRVIRGGGWFYAPNAMRCANRGFRDPAFRYDYVGFRLLRMP